MTTTGDKILGRDGFLAPTDLHVKCELSLVFILVGGDSQEADFGNGSRSPLQALPEDLSRPTLLTTGGGRPVRKVCPGT